MPDIKDSQDEQAQAAPAQAGEDTVEVIPAETQNADRPTTLPMIVDPLAVEEGDVLPDEELRAVRETRQMPVPASRSFHWPVSAERVRGSIENMRTRVKALFPTTEGKIAATAQEAISNSRGILKANEQIRKMTETGVAKPETAGAVFQGLKNIVDAKDIFPLNFETAMDGIGRMGEVRAELAPQAIKIIDDKYTEGRLKGEPMAKAVGHITAIVSRYRSTAPQAMEFLGRVVNGRYSGPTFENAVTAITVIGRSNNELAAKSLELLDRAVQEKRAATKTREAALAGIGDIAKIQPGVEIQGLEIMNTHLRSGQFRGKTIETLVTDMIDAGDRNPAAGHSARMMLGEAVSQSDSIRRSQGQVILLSFSKAADGEEFDAAKACLKIHERLQNMSGEGLTKKSLADAVQVLAARMSKPERLLRRDLEPAEVDAAAEIFTEIDASGILRERMDGTLMGLFNDVREIYEARARLGAQEEAFETRYAGTFSQPGATQG